MIFFFFFYRSIFSILLLLQANKYLDPTSLFQGEVQETIPKIQGVIDTMEEFK